MFPLAPLPSLVFPPANTCLKFIARNYPYEADETEVGVEAEAEAELEAGESLHQTEAEVEEAALAGMQIAGVVVLTCLALQK